MRNISDDLARLVQAAKPRLLSISDSQASEKPLEDKWSLKEILGHLVDSAANNHQRIVRLQESPDIGRLTYSQQHWVRSQKYQSAGWSELVEFWFLYNSHLSRIIGEIDPEALHNSCDMGYASPATLQFVVEDYVRHVEHHLGQLLGDRDPLKREKWVSRDPGAGGQK